MLYVESNSGVCDARRPVTLQVTRGRSLRDRSETDVTYPMWSLPAELLLLLCPAQRGATVDGDEADDDESGQEDAADDVPEGHGIHRHILGASEHRPWPSGLEWEPAATGNHSVAGSA